MRNLKTTRRRADLRAGRDGWYKIRNADGAAGPAAEVLIYDEIGYWGVMAEDLIRDLKEITTGEISLRINSPGGGIFEGIAIYNVLRSHPANVTAYVDSLAASIASVIAMAGDKVVMQPFSQLMIHDGSGMCIGNAADMEDMAEMLNRQSDNIAAVYAARAGGTAAEWRARMQSETWFTAEEAVEAGLADEVVDARREQPEEGDDDPDMSNSWDLSIFNYAGREFAPAPAFAKALAVHHTDTTDGAWDGPGAVAGMPGEASVLKYCHAWESSDGDPDAKGSYKFPHHKTEGGPANLAACRNGLARLSSADIPDGDRAGVEAHLRAHLNDADDSEDGGEDAMDPETGTEPENADGTEREDAAPTPPDEEQPGEDEPEPGEDEPEEEDPEEDTPAKPGPPTDEWAEATAHLINPASDQDDEFATLTEAWK